MPKNLWARIACLALLLSLISVWWNSKPERRWGWFHNRHAYCTGCSRFLESNLRDYAEEHDGWFPKGGATPIASLGKSLQGHGQSEMSHYTSHALVGPMWEHYARHGVLTEEYSAFRYNEGLRTEDPDDLVLVYWREPTRWQRRERKGTVLGRNVLTAGLNRFRFYKEAEFQQMQAKTEVFLRDRKQRESIYALVSSNLVLVVNRTVLGTNQFRFTVALKNKGTSEVSLKLTRDGMLRHREGGSSGSDFLGKEGSEIRLAPGEERVLPGWSEVLVKFITKGGQPVGCNIERRSASDFASQGEDFVNTGRSGVRLGAGAGLSEALHEMTLQAVLWIQVDTGEIKALETVLKSPVLHYMSDLP